MDYKKRFVALVQFVTSNSCVSILCDGRLLASVPEAQWREKLAAARNA